MKFDIRAMTLAALALWGAATVARADAPPQGASAPAYTLRDTFVGSVIPTDVVSSALPFDKTWAELTPQQRDLVRADYESIAPGDEPPFPERGLKHVALPFVRVSEQTGDVGKVIASVTVDSHGQARDVVVYKSPSKEVTAVAIHALVDEKYKPAVCKGQPCTMAFVLRLELLQRFNAGHER
jgi:hypothetical protein